MKLITQVYIDSNTNPELPPKFERLDMFDFESIELTSSIKQVKEIDQVFTDFSQSFTVPASNNNNRIFFKWDHKFDVNTFFILFHFRHFSS